MIKRKCKVILIRHGSTIYSEQKRLYDGEEYPPINQLGKQQMETLSKWFIKSIPQFDVIYTSSSLRSIQSARILAKAYDLEHRIKDELHERKAGIWAGLTFEQIEEKYPEMLEQYHKDPYNYWPEGGETTQAVRNRIKKVMDEIVNAHEHQTVAIITHKSVIQSAIASVLDIDAEHQGKILVPTGSATQINYYTDWATLEYCSFIPQ